MQDKAGASAPLFASRGCHPFSFVLGPQALRQTARPMSLVAHGADPDLGLVGVVEQAERPLVGRLQASLVNHLAVELERRPCRRSRLSTRRFHALSSEAGRSGPRRFSGSRARLSGARPVPLVGSVGQPVDFHSVGLDAQRPGGRATGGPSTCLARSKTRRRCGRPPPSADDSGARSLACCRGFLPQAGQRFHRPRPSQWGFSPVTVSAYSSADQPARSGSDDKFNFSGIVGLPEIVDLAGGARLRRFANKGQPGIAFGQHRCFVHLAAVHERSSFDPHSRPGGIDTSRPASPRVGRASARSETCRIAIAPDASGRLSAL